MLGLVCGIADWIIIVTDWGGSRSGMWYLPPFVWVPVLWTSITIGCLAGVVFSSPRLGRFRGVALAFAGPGMLLLVRLPTPLREMTGLSTPFILLTWLVLTMTIATALSFLPLTRSRFTPLGLAGAILSAVVLTCLAADIDVTPHLRDSAAATPPARRNIALIFLDTAGYDDALRGPAPAMPNLAAFARRSASFDNAWAPAPWTIPSHLSVLTGNDPWRLRPEEGLRVFQTASPALAQRLRSRGYDTAAVMSNPLLGNPGFTRGYSRFTYSRASGVCRSFAGELLNRSWVHGGPRSPLCGWFIATEVTSRVLRFIERASRPYFVTVNYMDAHYPYYVPPECRAHDLHLMERAEREAFRRAAVASLPPPAVLQRAHQQHIAAMRCMDRSLRTLLAALERDPNTIVVVLADHGEQFGEHGLVQHGNSVYRQVLQVPLVIRIPGEPPSRVPAAVSITDVYRSILGAARVVEGEPTMAIADERLRRPAIASYQVQAGKRVEAGISATLDR
ncbi:MAG: sulfatase, partial [Thermoanaerobaculia bacterium]